MTNIGDFAGLALIFAGAALIVACGVYAAGLAVSAAIRKLAKRVKAVGGDVAWEVGRVADSFSCDDCELEYCDDETEEDLCDE